MDACAPAELMAKPTRCAGALVVSPQGHIPGVREVLPRDRPAIAIEYSSGDVYLESIKRLTTPSVIAVVSISRYFLRMACGVLASAVDGHHSTRSCLISSHGGAWPRAADVIVCDALAYEQVRSSRRTGMIFTYRLISDDCLETIAAAMSR